MQRAPSSVTSGSHDIRNPPRIPSRPHLWLRNSAPSFAPRLPTLSRCAKRYGLPPRALSRAQVGKCVHPKPYLSPLTLLPFPTRTTGTDPLAQTPTALSRPRLAQISLQTLPLPPSLPCCRHPHTVEAQTQFSTPHYPWHYRSTLQSLVSMGRRGLTNLWSWSNKGVLPCALLRVCTIALIT